MIRCKNVVKVLRQNKPLFKLLYTMNLAFTIAGCSLVPHLDAAKPELIEPVRIKADLFTVKQGTLTIELNGVGVVVPLKTDYLSFEIEGKLGQSAVKQGDSVKKGDVLFRLDSDNFDLQLMQQQLAVENISALLDKSSGGEINDIRIDQMNLAIERLKLNRLLVRQNKRLIVSPSDGVVTFVDDLRIGSPIMAYWDVVGIAHTDQLQLCYVGDLSAYMSSIEIGMPVVIQYKGASVKGKVSVTPRTASFDLYPQRAAILGKTLLFDFDGTIPAGIIIGENLEFKLELTRKQDILIIPRGALRNYHGRDFVLVVDGETRREVDVQRGLATQTEVEIVKGLNEGQQIVVN